MKHVLTNVLINFLSAFEKKKKNLNRVSKRDPPRIKID